MESAAPVSGLAQRALLIIDMQIGMFNGPEKPYQGARVLENINHLIAKARAAGAPIFAVRHTGPQGSPIAPGSPLSQLLPDLDIDLQCDGVFDKTRPNCFVKTDLAKWLRDADVQELVIAGMKTDYCIDTTCRAAADLGFRPVLVADAHSTTDSDILSAQMVIAHHNRILNGPFVKLEQTADCDF
jgi:nicotinamidase-related amidase